MKKLITVVLLCLAASGSFAETIVFLDKKTVKGEILEYRKDSVSLFDEEQGKITSYFKKQILYISFDTENEALQKKIEAQIINQIDSFKPGTDILIDSDGIIKKGRISQWLKKNILLDTGENIEEIGISDAFGIYFVQDKSYYQEKKNLEFEWTLINKDQTRLKAKIKGFKEDFVLLSLFGQEKEWLKKDLSWIFFGNENSSLTQKAELDYLNAYKYLPGNDLIVFKNGIIQKGTVIRLNGALLEYTQEGLIESVNIGNLYGLFYGSSDKTVKKIKTTEEPEIKKNREPESDQTLKKQPEGNFNNERKTPETVYFDFKAGVSLVSSYSDSANQSQDNTISGFFDFGFYITFTDTYVAGASYKGLFVKNASRAYFNLGSKKFFDRVNNGFFVEASAGISVSGTDSSSPYPYYYTSSATYKMDSSYLLTGGIGYAIERVKYESSYLLGLSVFCIYESGRIQGSGNSGAPYYAYTYIDTASKRKYISLLLYAGVFW